MVTWSPEELRKIAKPDELLVSPLREDGVTYGAGVPIWSVAVDNALYVRGYVGQKTRWYQDALRQKAGRISAAGITKEVAFEPVEGPIERPHRRRLSCEVPQQPLSGSHGRTHRLRHSQGHTA